MSTKKRVTFRTALSETGDTTGPLRCGTCKILLSLERPDQADLLHALQDESVSPTRIARALNMIGHEITAVSVARHRERSQDESSGCAATERKL